MTMTIEQLRAELYELRLRRDIADAHLLIRLTVVEAENMDLISAAGCTSFAQFLLSMNDIVSPARYENFKTGLAKIGTARALEIGSDATIVAGLVSESADAYVAACRDWVADHNGTLPTKQTARTLLRQVDPRYEMPQAVENQTKLRQLQAEVAKLRAENRQLQAANASLQSKLEKLEKRLAKKVKA